MKMAEHLEDRGVMKPLVSVIGATLIVLVLFVRSGSEVSFAQVQMRPTPRVAVLLSFSTEEARQYRDAFLAGMLELGYVEGRNVTFDIRTSDQDRIQVPALLDELAAGRPDVLVTDDNAASLLRARTPSLPIVLTASVDPVGQGLAHSLRQPGKNFTGLVLLFDQLAVKHVELMRDVRPRLRRVGMFVDSTSTRCRVVEDGARQAARSVGATFVPYPVASRGDIERAFVQMAAEPPDVMLPCPAALLFNNRDLLYAGAVRLRVPFTSFVVEALPVGVVFSYGAPFVDAHRRAATYVDKILKGAKPGDLPMEQPTKFALIVNLKTAKAFGLTIPPSVLARADQVIE